MAVVATPTNYLLLDLHEAIEETMLWVEGVPAILWLHTMSTISYNILYTDVCREDADEEVRSLAGHTHSLLAQQQSR